MRSFCPWPFGEFDGASRRRVDCVLRIVGPRKSDIQVKGVHNYYLSAEFAFTWLLIQPDPPGNEFCAGSGLGKSWTLCTDSWKLKKIFCGTEFWSYIMTEHHLFGWTLSEFLTVCVILCFSLNIYKYFFFCCKPKSS